MMSTEDHLKQIKLLQAIAAGKKLYVECYPTDKGAITFPNTNQAVKLIDLPETTALPVPDAPNKKKPFIVANVRDILDQYDPQSDESISYSRMVELFNEVAFKWMAQHKGIFTLEEARKYMGLHNTTLVEKFADNGEHSHWELVDKNGEPIKEFPDYEFCRMGKLFT